LAVWFAVDNGYSILHGQRTGVLVAFAEKKDKNKNNGASPFW